MTPQRVSMDDVAAHLNTMLRLSRTTVSDLMRMRVFCGMRTLRDPRFSGLVVESEYGTPTIGLLEVLNSLFAADARRIAPRSRGDHIIGFEVVYDK